MKNVILCAGAEYHRVSKDPFDEFCRRRKKQVLLSAARGTDITVSTFSFRAGTLQTTSLTWNAGKAVESTSTKKLRRPITTADYGRKGEDGEVNPIALKDNIVDVMSILDIYSFVQNMGKRSPNTLCELSIFSHADIGGPILLNSFDDRVVGARESLPSERSQRRASVPVPRGRRDPDDKDGRAELDFSPPNMDDLELINFRQAFSTKGYAWIWGCNFDDDANRVLALVERALAGKQNADSSHKLSFTSLNNELIDSILFFNNIFQLDSQQLRRSRKCILTLGQVKSAIWEQNASSFASRMASATKVKVMGALYGTFAAFDKGPASLMAIDSSTVRHVAFYKRHLGFNSDVEGRNYGVFEAGANRPL